MILNWKYTLVAIELTIHFASKMPFFCNMAVSRKSTFLTFEAKSICHRVAALHSENSRSTTLQMNFFLKMTRGRVYFREAFTFLAILITEFWNMHTMHKKWWNITGVTRTTRMPAFWEYLPPPHDYQYYWFISDPESKNMERILEILL